MCTPANRSKSRALHTQQQEWLEVLDEEEAASHRAEADTRACQARHSELIAQCERLQAQHAMFGEELREADSALAVVSQDEHELATDLQLRLLREDEVRAVESEELARLTVESRLLESEASEASEARHAMHFDSEESPEACVDSWIAAREVLEARRAELLRESRGYSARRRCLEAELPELRATAAAHEAEAQATELRVHELAALESGATDGESHPDRSGHPPEGKHVSVQSIWALDAEAEEASNRVRSLEQELEAAMARNEATEVAGSNLSSRSGQPPQAESASVPSVGCKPSSMPDVGLRLQMLAGSWCRTDSTKEIAEVRHFLPPSPRAACGSGDDSLDPQWFEDPTAAARLMAENSRLREQLSEITKERHRQPLGTVQDGRRGDAVLAPIVEAQARLQAAMVAQVQESREAVAYLQRGLKDSELRLQRERRLREHSEYCNSEWRESREPARVVGLDMLQRQAGPDSPSSSDDSVEGDLSFLGLRRKLLAR